MAAKSSIFQTDSIKQGKKAFLLLDLPVTPCINSVPICMDILMYNKYI